MDNKYIQLARQQHQTNEDDNSINLKGKKNYYLLT